MSTLTSRRLPSGCARRACPTSSSAPFEHYYEQLAAGHTGLIPEAEIRAGRRSLPDLEQLSAGSATDGPRGPGARPSLLKLNGGLGTGMGLEKAKSLLTSRTG